MKFGVLGTGMVGQTIASKRVTLGHEVMLGSRRAGNEKARAWTREAGKRASQGSNSQQWRACCEVLNVTLLTTLEVPALRSAGYTDRENPPPPWEEGA